MLLVDLDPQGNATTGGGVDKRALRARPSTTCCSASSRSPTCACALPSRRLRLVPANRELAGAEVELVELERARDARLKRCAARHRVRRLRLHPDRLPAVAVAAHAERACAADAVLIPMQCEYYALEGLSDLVQTVKKVRAHLNPRARDRRPAAHDVRPAQHARAAGLGGARAAFRRQGLSHRDPAQHAPRRGAEHGMPVLQLDQASKGAQAYLALAGEMLNRNDVEVHRSAMTVKLKGLGRGLDALLGGGESGAARATTRCATLADRRARARASTSRARTWTTPALASSPSRSARRA